MYYEGITCLWCYETQTIVLILMKMKVWASSIRSAWEYHIDGHDLWAINESFRSPTSDWHIDVADKWAKTDWSISSYHNHKLHAKYNQTTIATTSFSNLLIIKSFLLMLLLLNIMLSYLISCLIFSFLKKPHRSRMFAWFMYECVAVNLFIISFSTEWMFLYIILF